MGMLLNFLGMGKLKLIAIGVVVAVLAGMALTIKIQSSRIDTLTAQVAAERTAHETTKASFAGYREEAEAQAARTQVAMTDLAQSRHDAQSEIIKLTRKLQRHDLAYLMKKKPKLIERRINAATDELFRDITWNPEDNTWSSDDEAMYWIWVIDHDIGHDWPCWLHYSSIGRAGGNCRGSHTTFISAPAKAATYSADVHRLGGRPGTVMRGRYKPKRGIGLSRPEAVRNPRAGFLPDHRILA